jgi:integrase
MPHDLITLADSPPGALTTAEIDATMEFAEAEKSPATRKAYAADWADFAAWCAERDACSLPAHQGIVAAYLSHLAAAGRKASTIGRRCASIAWHHRQAGIEHPPTAAPGVRSVLKGMRRSIGTATHDLVAAMLATCGTDLRGWRDRALLAFGFASAMRRSELVALRVEDLTETAEGYRVLIRRSKTDQEGQGQVIAIPTGSRLRPVEAVKQWLEAAAITEGPLFRRIDAPGETDQCPAHGSLRCVAREAPGAAGGPRSGATIWP